MNDEMMQLLMTVVFVAALAFCAYRGGITVGGVAFSKATPTQNKVQGLTVLAFIPVFALLLAGSGAYQYFVGGLPADSMESKMLQGQAQMMFFYAVIISGAFHAGIKKSLPAVNR